MPLSIRTSDNAAYGENWTMEGGASAVTSLKTNAGMEEVSVCAQGLFASVRPISTLNELIVRVLVLLLLTSRI